MKLIYREQNSKIFLGNNFKQDISALFKISHLKQKTGIFIIGYQGFIRTKYYYELKDTAKDYEITVAKQMKVKPNPNQSYIDKLSKVNLKIDFILAIGGGSAIDVGKLAKHYLYKSANLITIYTLPGSATIVTPFAVFDNEEFKIGIGADNLIPNYTYINQQIIQKITLDRRAIAVADIFSHAIESFYSEASTGLSRKRARAALQKIVMQQIKKISARSLITADIEAGLSERVGMVLFPHAAGHYLTYRFKIPHSIATMYFLITYLNLLKDKGINIDKRHLQYSNYLKSWLKKRGLMPKLRLSQKDITALFSLTQKYMSFAYKNAPIKIRENEYKKIVNHYVSN